MTRPRNSVHFYVGDFRNWQRPSGVSQNCSTWTPCE